MTSDLIWWLYAKSLPSDFAFELCTTELISMSLNIALISFIVSAMSFTLSKSRSLWELCLSLFSKLDKCSTKHANKLIPSQRSISIFYMTLDIIVKASDS